MLGTNTGQKQCTVYQKNDPAPGFALKHTRLEVPYIIKTMMKVIKTKSKDSMDAETGAQFSNFADAVIRMAEEI